MITACLKWRLAAYHIINTAPDSIGTDSVGASGQVDLANKMDKFVTKIPEISTDLTQSSSENSTVSKTEDSSSADVRQKKGWTFQASWKGKYQWIILSNTKYFVWFALFDCGFCFSFIFIGAFCVRLH